VGLFNTQQIYDCFHKRICVCLITQIFRLRGIACYIALAISGGSVNAWADDSIQFDPRFLELKGDTKIDLGKFSKKGYVDAGKYNLRVFINKQPF